MKILFIGGTGTISMAITRLLAGQGHDLTLLNRGNRNQDTDGDADRYETGLQPGDRFV